MVSSYFWTNKTVNRLQTAMSGFDVQHQQQAMYNLINKNKTICNNIWSLLCFYSHSDVFSHLSLQPVRLTKRCRRKNLKTGLEKKNTLMVHITHQWWLYRIVSNKKNILCKTLVFLCCKIRSFTYTNLGVSEWVVCIKSINLPYTYRSL